MVFGFCSNPLNFNQTISERTTKTHQKQWNLLAFKNTTHTKYPFISRDCEVGQLDDLSEERRTFVAKVPQSQRCLLHVLLLKPHKTSAIMWLRPVHHLPFLLYPPTHTPAPTCQCCTHTGLHSHWTLELQQCSHCVFFSALWSRPSLVQASHHIQHQQFHWVEWADTAADFCLPSGKWHTSMQAPKTDAYLIIYGTSRCLLMTEPMNNLKWRFSLN